MIKGFTYGVAPNLIEERPGMTADEVAQLALDRGLWKSDSKTPVRSGAATLAKEVREGRQKQVRAERVDGVLRYYPLFGGQTLSKLKTPAYDEVVSIRVPRAHLEIADLLVEAGQCRTRSEALAWLVAEGIFTNESRIEKVKKAVGQIRAIKESLSVSQGTGVPIM